MQKPLRSDARRKREAILDAAAQTLTASGFGAPMDRIAQLAGVGQATLYRHFPDRPSLLLALLDRDMTGMEARVAAAPADARSQVLFRSLAGCLVDSPAFAEYWRSAGLNTPEAEIGRRRLIALGQSCIPADVAADRLRKDLTPDDLPLIATMLGAILCGRDREERESLRDRALDLLSKGLVRPTMQASPETTMDCSPARLSTDTTSTDALDPTSRQAPN